MSDDKTNFPQPADQHLPAQWQFSLAAALLLMAPFDLLASMAMDIYLPVVPHMPEALQTSPAIIQLTLSLYMAILGSGQLIFGPLSDKYGRRPVLLGGALLFTIASAILAITSSAQVFVIARLLQATGAAAMLVTTFATVRDVYADRTESAVIYSLFGSMLAFVPALAPLLGALLDMQFGWRSIFWLLALLGLFSALHAAWRWPETRTTQPAPAKSNLYNILTNTQFWIYTSGFSTAMGSFFVYFSTAPRLLMDQLGLSSIVFSLCFGSIAVVMIIFARYARYYTQWWGLRGTLRRAMFLIMSGGILLFIAGAIFELHIASFLIAMWVIAAGIALSGSVTANGALQPFSACAGLATAIYYCIESLAVSLLGTAAVLLLGGDTILPIVAFTVLSALFTLVLSIKAVE